MEIIAIIFILWLIGCLFPGSGESYGPDFGDIAGFLAGAILLIGLFFAWGYSVAGIMMAAEWLGFTGAWVILLALLGPIAVPMLIAASVNAALERRKVRA